MKTKSLLMILVLHFAFCVLPSTAQIPSQNGSRANYPDLYHPFNSKTYLEGIIRNPDFTFINPNNYSLSLINDQGLLYEPLIQSNRKSETVKIYGISGTIDGKWKMLTGEPLIDTSKVYYSPVKRPQPRSLTDSRFYRTLGGSFNAIMNATYPSRTAPK